MAKIKISQENTDLEIEFNLKIRIRPKVEKLKKELSNFFENNEILGINIKEFDVKISTGDYSFGVIVPNLNGRKFGSPELDYCEKIQKIGEKYNLEQLRFSLDCYGK